MKNDDVKKEKNKARKAKRDKIIKDVADTVKETVIPEKSKNEETYYKGEHSFNFARTFKVILILLLIVSLYIVITKVYKSLSDKDSFHAISLKSEKEISDKQEAINNAYSAITDIYDSNNNLSVTNLNLAKVYEVVVDDEELALKNAERNLPIPVTMDEDKEPEIEKKSAAFQIFEKLQNKYQMMNQSLYNLCGMNPVNIVRQYHYDGYSIIGKYNPENPTHVKGKRSTYFIPNFTNVNIKYIDGDGAEIEEDNNIKDIMSMASVYSYYHDPYDSRNFLKHCYDLFDNSYNYVASISEVYYCSGCMHYDENKTATNSTTEYGVTLDKVNTDHSEQKVLPKDIPSKAGTLTKMKDGSYNIIDGGFDEYVKDIYNGKKVTDNNYCPGHIDLNLVVSVLTLDASRGLASIDKNYGNKGLNYNKNWHGWDKLMLNRARILSYKDWEKEYGISISYVDFIKPLTQEEVNYYMNRLDKNLSKNRKLVVETALKSVGRIPYYYGGKTSRAGYEANMFGTKILPDYKGRCLKGLDCSGWINWVYLTAFNKYLIKSEGTAKLAQEGTRITRKELLPGDLIIRPGIDSHVMMFLEWAPGGKVKVIHENGSVNNVCIGTFDAYYPYYRRIINT